MREEEAGSPLDFRALFEATPGAYLVLRPDNPVFTIAGVNDAYLRATLTRREEIVGRGLFEVFPDNPEDRGATGTRNLGASLRRVLESRAPDAMAIQKYDIPRPASEGGGFEERYWSPLNSPVLDGRGEVAWLIHRVDDVTERVRLEQRGAEQRQFNEELRARAEKLESEVSRSGQELQAANELLRVSRERRRYELLASHSRDIVLFIRRADGRILEANAAALSAYGYGREELLSLTIGDLRAPDTLPLTDSQMAAADAGGILFETVHRRRGGATFPVEVSSKGATVEGRRTLISVVRDITERRRAEEALRESETRYRALFEKMIDAFAYHRVVLDESGRPSDYVFLEANEAFEKMTGLERADILGRRVREVMPGIENDPADWIGTYGRVALSGQEIRFEQYAVPLGRWYSVAAYSPKRGHFVTIFEDVTDRKRAEETLRQAHATLTESDRRKSEFIAVLSHELRNPLAPIRNCLYLLDRAAPGSEQAARATGIIRRQAEHLTRLVDDLLDVTRISRGKIELLRARLDLREVVRRTCDDHGTLFDGRGIALRVEAPAPVWVEADATRIAQVVGNLLQNAAKFSHEGGAVAVRVGVVEGQARIQVHDDGIGISPDLLPRLFEPFVQAEGDLARTRGGLGLGLALMKGLVELHGGAVSAQSEGLGRGATFVVSLPLAQAPPPAAVRPAPAAALRGIEILVIEDNADAAHSIADLLEMEGHRVHVATDGRSGIARARELKPQVVLCDIGLPDMDGYHIARTLRADDGLRATLLIALSGYAQPEDRRLAKEAGFDAHLAKPPSPGALLASIAAGGER